MKIAQHIQHLKNIQYDYIYKYYSYIAQWRPYAYRKIKVVIYVNVCAWLIYLFMKLKVKPNTLTAVYALMGLLGGFLLAMPSHTMVLIGVSFFYFRPFLDWADGPLARETNQTSLTGDILDSYAAPLGWVALWSAMGLYLGRTTHPIFYSLAPLAPFFFAVDIYAIARERLIYHHLKCGDNSAHRKGRSIATQPSAVDSNNSGLRRIKRAVDAVFEHNSRTLDIICYVLLIEVIFSVSIIWAYYLSFLCWQGCVFTMRLFALYKGGWAEAQFDELKRRLF